jgi:hypothetical protein
MKKIIYTYFAMKILTAALLLSLMFSACEKEPYLIPENEVPEWLKSRISRDEAEMSTAPQSMLYYGGWIRYEWDGEYYFEYHNELSSSMPQPISESGNALHIHAFDTTTEYYKEKCCKQYVWKAPKFRDLTECIFVNCTEEFRSIVVSIKHASDGSAYRLTDYKVIRTSDGKDITPASDNYARDNGYYPVANDLMTESFRFKTVEVIFKGYHNGALVIQKKFVITADCCHISLVEGETSFVL